jgi:hypothetical protein
MNLHRVPSSIWWAEQAGEDKARSRYWMEKAREPKASKEHIADCVRHARYYHREYRLHLKMALDYLKAREYVVRLSAGGVDSRCSPTPGADR